MTRYVAQKVLWACVVLLMTLCDFTSTNISATLGGPTCDAPHERDANRTRYSGAVEVQGRPYVNDGHTSLLSKHSFLRGDEVYLQVWLVVMHMFDFELRRAKLLGSDLLILQSLHQNFPSSRRCWPSPLDIYTAGSPVDCASSHSDSASTTPSKQR